MGTNYYAIENKCSECGRQDRFHIGKNSWGWNFGVDISHGKYDDYESLCDYLRSVRIIVDEYGDEYSVNEIVDIILNEDMKHPDGNKSMVDEVRPSVKDDYEERDIGGHKVDFCNRSFT